MKDILKNSKIRQNEITNCKNKKNEKQPNQLKNYKITRYNE